MPASAGAKRKVITLLYKISILGTVWTYYGVKKCLIGTLILCVGG